MEGTLRTSHFSSLRTFLLAVLLAVPACVAAEAEEVYVYKAVLLQRPASITLDGDLSDWEGLDVEARTIGNVVRGDGVSKKFAEPSGEADLSGNFRCFADPENFYVAVEVRDDKPVFGEEPFGGSHDDDAVEIYFDGDCVQHAYRKGACDYDANDAEIRFSKGRDGNVRLEGQGLFGGRLFMFPGLWESLGIAGAIKEHPGGYTAEMKVPKMVFVSVPLEVGVQIGFNVMINDDDDGGDRDSKISWTADLLDESYLTTRYFGRLVIERASSPCDPLLPFPPDGETLKPNADR